MSYTMPRYHFRDLLGTRLQNKDGSPTVSYDDFERTLLLAYQLSSDLNKAVYVCRESGTVDMPSFTEIVSVRACK